MLETMLENVRLRHPLVHNITNYVTVNDCANIIIACGGSPIMADDKQEVAEITAQCAALNVNIGTLNTKTIESMFIAAKTANEHKLPVVLDPVGMACSRLRTQTVFDFLDCLHFSVIRGNISEIKAIASTHVKANGVDADASDIVNETTVDSTLNFAKRLAEKLSTVIAVSGAIDIVADKERAYCIRNGHPLMSSVSGTGCQLSAMTAAFLAANPTSPLEATAAAVATMGYAGEIAFRKMRAGDGNATYRNYIIDAVYNMTPEMLKEGVRYELR